MYASREPANLHNVVGMLVNDRNGQLTYVCEKTTCKGCSD